MLIDWFTVGPQVVNFVILVGLLRHFLYKPILKTLDGREKFIADELADAKAKKSEATKERDDFEAKNKAFDEQRAALLGKAVDEAKAERERLGDAARKEIATNRAIQEKALRDDLATQGEDISRRASEEVFGIARKALTDLATVSLEERMGEVFTRRLHQMNGKEKEVLGNAIRTSPDPVVVRSAFEMPSEQRAAIQNALNETFSAEVRVRFETSTGIMCGIELAANGQKVGWSIADYLGSLGKSVDALIAANIEPSPVPVPAPASKINTTPDPGALAAAR